MKIPNLLAQDPKRYHSEFEQELRSLKQNYTIDNWCRQLGLSRSKLEKHPNIEDIRILIDIRNYSTWFNKKDQQVFDHIWRQVYEYEYPLSVYHKRKLDQVVTSVEYQRKHMKKKVTMMSKKGLPLAKFN